MNAKQHLIKSQMGSDTRIPPSAIGYIADLSPESSPSIIADRLNMLSRYVPDLVAEYRAAENTTKSYSCVLLRANSVEGIRVADIVDYPEAEIMSVDTFRSNLKDADETDIFTLIMPPTTDGDWESIDAEYGIRK